MSAATQIAPQGFMPYEDAAEYLGITVSALRQAVSAGNLHPHKFPHIARKYLTRQQLDDYRAGKHRQAVDPRTTPTSGQGAVALAEALASAASGPLLEGWRETRKGLTAVAIASVFQAQGISLDPKCLAG